MKRGSGGEVVASKPGRPLEETAKKRLNRSAVWNRIKPSSGFKTQTATAKAATVVLKPKPLSLKPLQRF